MKSKYCNARAKVPLLVSGMASSQPRQKFISVYSSLNKNKKIAKGA